METPLSLFSIKVRQAELIPSNLWCSITVNPMKPRWLCINQCHMFTERWAVLPLDVLKPTPDCKTAGELLNTDSRRHTETGHVNPWSYCTSLSIEGQPTIKGESLTFLGFWELIQVGISRHAVHHFYEGQVAMAVRRRHRRKWLMTLCLLWDTHSKTIGSLRTSFWITQSLCHWTWSFYSIFN